MNLFNKVFSGGQIDKQIAPDLSTNHIADLRDDPLLPLHGLAAGEEATIPKFHQATLDSNKAIHQALEQEFGNLDAYENLQSKLNVSELSDIYSTLESISNTVNSLNQSNPSSATLPLGFLVIYFSSDKPNNISLQISTSIYPDL